MTVNKNKGDKMKVKIETGYPFPRLRTLAKHLRQYNPTTRDVTAQIIEGHGLQAHKGGRHVAIIQDGVRLAICTSTAPDFN